jgi:hypothetical protein
MVPPLPEDQLVGDGAQAEKERYAGGKPRQPEVDETHCGRSSRAGILLVAVFVLALVGDLPPLGPNDRLVVEDLQVALASDEAEVSVPPRVAGTGVGA